MGRPRMVWTRESVVSVIGGSRRRADGGRPAPPRGAARRRLGGTTRRDVRVAALSHRSAGECSTKLITDVTAIAGGRVGGGKSFDSAQDERAGAVVAVRGCEWRRGGIAGITRRSAAGSPGHGEIERLVRDLAADV